MNKLSKRENKYRIKIIQECHYNKHEQRRLDGFVTIKHLSYKEIYIGIQNGVHYPYMTLIANYRLAKSFENFGKSCKEANTAFQKLGQEIKKQNLM